MKREYQKPTMKIVLLSHQSHLLAGTGLDEASCARRNDSDFED